MSRGFWKNLHYRGGNAFATEEDRLLEDFLTLCSLGIPKQVDSFAEYRARYLLITGKSARRRCCRLPITTQVIARTGLRGTLETSSL